MAEDEKSEDPSEILKAMTSAEKDEYREAFRLFDKDGDGQVTVDEIMTVFHALGFTKYSKEDITKMVAAQDMDGDLCIDLDEFIVMLRSKKPRSSTAKPQTFEEELRQAFKVFDINGDGAINSEELASVMQALGEDLTSEDIDWMIKAIDDNADGEIDFDEFKKMMSLKPPAATES